MKNEKEKIDNITAVLMIGTAILIDGIQFFLILIFIGFAINWLISILAWMTFFLWLTLSGVNFMRKPQILFTLSAGGLCWTAAISRIIFVTKVKSKIKKAI